MSQASPGTTSAVLLCSARQGAKAAALPGQTGGDRESHAAPGSALRHAQRGASRSAGSSDPCPSSEALPPGHAHVRPGPRPHPRRSRLTSARTARATSTSSASFMQYSAAGLGSVQGTLSAGSARARHPARRSPAPAALPAPRCRPPPPSPESRGRRCPLVRRRPHPGRELPPPRARRHAQAGRCRRGAFRPSRPRPLPRPTGSAGELEKQPRAALKPKSRQSPVFDQAGRR